MRVLRIALAVFLFLAIGFGAFGCNRTPEEIKFLKAVNSDIRTNNGKGEVILLKGVNAGGLFVIEEWMSPVSAYTQSEMESVLNSRFGDDAKELLNIFMDNWWTEEDFDNVAEMGFNLIRLPLLWTTLQNSDYTYKENAFARMDWFIEQAARRGIYTILDLHGAHGSQNGKHHSGDVSTGGALYSSEENMSLTEELWVTIAKRYKDNPFVAGYDLLNEPEGTPGGIMSANTPHWDYYDRLYKAIRQVDPNHIIIMEAVWEIYSLPNPLVYNWENVVYQCHFYCWNNYSNYTTQKNFMDTKKQYSRLSNYNVPQFIGEYSFFDNPYSWNYGLSVFDSEGWSSAVWTYKVMGNNSWGIYISDSENLRVNPYLDSYEEIRDKWSALRTSENFVANEWLYDILKEYAGGNNG